MYLVIMFRRESCQIILVIFYNASIIITYIQHIIKFYDTVRRLRS